MRSNIKNPYTREHVKVILLVQPVTFYRAVISVQVHRELGSLHWKGRLFSGLPDKQQITSFFYLISFPKHAFCKLLPARIIKWKLLCFDKCGVKLAMLQNIP